MSIFCRQPLFHLCARISVLDHTLDNPIWVRSLQILSRKLLLTLSGRLQQHGQTWKFQEDGASWAVEATVPEKMPTQKVAAWLEAQLYQAVRAQYIKEKKKAEKVDWEKRWMACQPQAVADLKVVGSTPEGKLRYKWEGIEVVVTPREQRTECIEAASAWSRASARESTPERAFRKVKEKFKRSARQAAMGKHDPVVVKAAVEEASAGAAEPGASEPRSQSDVHATPALASLADPEKVKHVRAAYEFLQSIRLHHCENCDEEWPVFDAEWPQGGEGPRNLLNY